MKDKERKNIHTKINERKERKKGKIRAQSIKREQKGGDAR